METTLKTKLITKNYDADSASDPDLDSDLFDPPGAPPRYQMPAAKASSMLVGPDLREIASLAMAANDTIAQGDPMEVDDPEPGESTPSPLPYPPKYVPPRREPSMSMSLPALYFYQDVKFPLPCVTNHKSEHTSSLF